MMALLPNLQLKLWGQNNLVLSGGKMEFFEHGTGYSVKAPTYQTEGGSENPNPLTLNSLGESQVWLDPTIVYDIRVTNALGGEEFTREAVSISGGGGSTPTGQFILRFTADGVKQYVNTDIYNNAVSGAITFETLQSLRNGVTTIQNTAKGPVDALTTNLPSSGKLTINGMNEGTSSSSLEVSNNVDQTKLPVVTTVERLGASNPLDGASAFLQKTFDAEANTFEMWDSVHGEVDRYARLGDIPTPVDTSLFIRKDGGTATTDIIPFVEGTSTILGAITSSKFAHYTSVEWANAADGFLAPWRMDVTNTGSLNNSAFFDIRMGGQEVFSIKTKANATPLAPITVADTWVDMAGYLFIGGGMRSVGASFFDDQNIQMPNLVTGISVDGRFLTLDTNGKLVRGTLPVAPVTKPTATLQYAKGNSITANTVISPATAGPDWQGGHNMGQGTHPTKTFKVTSINSTLMRYITNSPGTITMRLAYVTPEQSLAYNAGTGTTIASWIGNVPNTSGAEKFYFNFVNNINVTLPQGVVVFVECTNRSMTTCEGISILLNLEEV